jgi:hypothetical protein
MPVQIEDDMTPAQREQLSKLEEQARQIARPLDLMLNPVMSEPGFHFGGDRTVGFALLIFAFGLAPQPVTWISNADRGDMIHAVEEWLKQAKART